MKKHIYAIAIMVSFGFFSCQSDEIQNDMDLEEYVDGHQVVYSDLRFDPVSIDFADPNARIQTDHEYDMVLHSATYITAPESNEMGRTVIFSDRGNKQLEFDFSPLAKLNGIPDISYYVDQLRPAFTLDIDQTDAAIERAATTWKNASCSELELYRESNLPIPIGIVAGILGFPSAQGYIADVNHAGWMPPSFFGLLAPGGENFILGVTFTFLLIDGEGNTIDTNNDGKLDVALREIYYNNNFIWSDGAGLDVETVALHEMGHGLSQEHFGKAFVKKKGGFQISPRAVMNASYSGVQTSLTGTDNAGHCSIWGNWPNN